jgi:hypothetical protein
MLPARVNLGSVPAPQRDETRRRIASIEIEDGTAIGALHVIGEARFSATEAHEAIEALERDGRSTDPELNTAAQLAKTANAISLIEIKERMRANQLLTSSLELSVNNARKEREVAAKAQESAVIFQAEHQKYLNSDGADAAIRRGIGR